MTTDRDLRNQLLYAIKTNDLDALAGKLTATHTTNEHDSCAQLSCSFVH